MYVLLCEGDHYYVGLTGDLSTRLISHFNNNGSQWTKLHPPTKMIVELVPNCDEFDEHNCTLKYMNQFGVDKVRGAEYSKTELTTYQKKAINDTLNHLFNRCFTCNSSNHYSSHCDRFLFDPQPQEEVSCCVRCGRNSHGAQSCYAKTHFRGHEI